MGRLVRQVLALGFAASAPGCVSEPRPAPPNMVIVILADTLRADQLGAYGAAHSLTPFIDELAARAFVFQSAYAAAPWTAPSVAALFTARFPSQLGILRFGSVLQEQETTLAELFRRHGYATGGFLAHWFMAGHGYEQGFDVFRQITTPPKTRAPEINAAALAWVDQVIAGAKEPRIFLYLHYIEPHTPYAPPAEALARVWSSDQPLDVDEVNRALRGPARQASLSPDLLERALGAYRAEVVSLDESLRDLFAALEARRLLANAVVVLTADHGEGFQEHGYTGHAQSLFNELIRVPLIISVPRLTARVDVADPVSLVDVAPTLLDWTESPTPNAVQGRSLAPLMRREWPDWLRPIRARWNRWGEEVRPVFSERAWGLPPALYPEHGRAVVLDSGKYITAPGQKESFYDLAADPDERNPNGLTSSARRRLRGHLEQFVARIDDDARVEQVTPIREDVRERMRALGYADQ